MQELGGLLVEMTWRPQGASGMRRAKGVGKGAGKGETTIAFIPTSNVIGSAEGVGSL